MTGVQNFLEHQRGPAHDGDQEEAEPEALEEESQDDEHREFGDQKRDSQGQEARAESAYDGTTARQAEGTE